MSLAYGAALLVSITGMIVLDRRFRLFFWLDAKRAGAVMVAGVLFFLAWDLVGIGMGIFFRGEGPHQSGLVIAPELPVEEVLFLILLCYTTMNTFGAVRSILVMRQQRRRSRRRRDDGGEAAP